MVKLEFLGRFADIVPAELRQPLLLPQSVQTLTDLCDWIARTVPGFREQFDAPRTRIVVNHNVVHDMSHVIENADEIAFLPAMSGG